jgi:predicted DCC family thiol-disulfide oxidoreductase YuxK
MSGSAGPRLAARLAARAAYSYRTDPAVPPFPDDKPVIVYDGVCVLCSSAMRRIARRDRGGKYRFAAGQSPVGTALFRHYGLDPADFESVLLIEDGRCHGKLDMARRVARQIGGPWRLFELFAILPAAMQDRCYDLVAGNRYSVFGRTETCMVPDASWRDRVIE